MAMPETGTAVDLVIDELEAKRAHDVRWDLGRTFGLVYDGGPSVHEVAERAARLFLHENALNTKAFPSLGAIQAEVVGWTASLLGAPPEAAGFMTSGGTESILCAVFAARERGLAQARRFASRVQQHTRRRSGAASDATAQLMQLAQTKTLGVLHHHQRGVGHVHPDFDHRSADQHAHLALGEQRHHRLLLGLRHARVQ